LRHLANAGGASELYRAVLSRTAASVATLKAPAKPRELTLAAIAPGGNFPNWLREAQARGQFTDRRGNQRGGVEAFFECPIFDVTAYPVDNVRTRADHILGRTGD
jgi:hypothetical protein